VTESDSNGKPTRGAFARRVNAQLARKLEARNNPARVVPFGLGMMGLIGWSVAVPTLLGTALGIWLDRHYPGGHSWTLALLIAGLTLGCWAAWRWVASELATFQRNDHDDPR
jgi:ATP synthase protein I